MAWMSQVLLLLWLVLCVAGQAGRNRLEVMHYTPVGKGRCATAPILAQRSASLVLCAALCSNTVKCDAFSLGPQGRAPGDWTRRTCELIEVAIPLLELLTYGDPLYRCYVKNESISSASATTTTLGFNIPFLTTSTAPTPPLSTTPSSITTAPVTTTDASPTTVTTATALSSTANATSSSG